MQFAKRSLYGLNLIYVSDKEESDSILVFSFSPFSIRGKLWVNSEFDELA